VDAKARLWKTLKIVEETISLMQNTISQIREPETKGSSDLNGESTTIKGRKVAEQEVGINTQTGEHSSVCLFPFSNIIQFIMIVFISK
jgi:hypothetical protein